MHVILSKHALYLEEAEDSTCVEDLHGGAVKINDADYIWMIYQISMHFGKGHDEKYHLSRTRAVWRTWHGRLLFRKASCSKHVFHIIFIANMAYSVVLICQINLQFYQLHIPETSICNSSLAADNWGFGEDSVVGYILNMNIDVICNK